MGSRRSPLSLFFVVLLMVLTASPFTYPFQVVDLSADAASGPGPDDLFSKQAPKDGNVPMLLTLDMPPVVPAILPVRRLPTGQQHFPISLIELRV